MRLVHILVMVVTISACSMIAASQLTITSPTGGDYIDASTTIVTGTGPANTEITQDIPASPDQHTLTDAKGNWQMIVDLHVGQNVLTFRVGDDQQTKKQILVIRSS